MKIVLVFLVSLVILTSCGSISKVLKSNDIEFKYKKAVEYFGKKKYSYVIQIFDERFFPQLKGSKEFEEAFYMLAYSHFYEKDYFNAENLFRQYAETFSSNPRSTEMAYMRSYTYYKQSPKVDLEQTNTLKTIGMMNQFISQHPTSDKVKEALEIIEICQGKLEAKDFKAAELYYHMGQFKAAYVAFNAMLNTFPETNKGDEYKFMAIKAYYQYAQLSVEDRKAERFEQIVNDCNDFIDRYPESKLIKEIERYSANSTSNLKNIKNEQTKKTTSS